MDLPVLPLLKLLAADLAREGVVEEDAVRADVALQVGQLGEALAAVVTVELLGAGVDQHVLVQVAHQVEALAAHRAHMRLDLRVTPHVLLQPARVLEQFLADGTRDGLLQVDVAARNRVRHGVNVVTLDATAAGRVDRQVAELLTWITPPKM